MNDLALGRANGLAHTIYRELAHADSRRYAGTHPTATLVRVRRLARELVESLDTAARDDRYRDLSYARALIENLFETIELAHEHLTGALSLDLARATGIAGGIAHNLSHFLAAELASGRGTDLAGQVALQATPESDEGALSPAGRTGNLLASRLTAAAVRLLPTAHRSRYREEFEAELQVLGDTSRLTQWAYAARILIAIWPLRRSLGSAGAARANE